ncbi:acyl-CoA dehydrogenase [Comamonas serinivorans]|uniref:Acyl-CoA dehydrogenase n=1 Tax=Comamonas serinivorans TaxID=1082851 RepID=A0A1Y0EJM7_9BURK|nr:acyl-CoA dehydrogenase family protein [Comamonas serinivorans]ARU03786.1 acyl-CoA dehydrogenase [Comamonas serinivorans]
MTPSELAEARDALVTAAQRFARTEIAPHASAWDAAGEFPRALYKRAAELGFLGLGYPEAYGGTPAPRALRVALSRTLARHAAAGGTLSSLMSHGIGLPPVIALGSEALKREVVPEVLAGERISALAITEPGGGSDVAALKTHARREGDDYVVNGEKIFITSGMRADWITLAVRTDPASKGAGGISLLLVPGDSRGLSRTRLDKMGWLASDTAHLRFDEVRVPARYLLGEEHKGFRAIMGNFNSERYGIASSALGYAEACYDEALAWAQQRQAFGSALVEHQVIRHKLVDMQQRIQATGAWLDHVVAQADAGINDAAWVASVCMLKNQATQTFQFCADAGVQILGGMGFMRGTVVERLYREVKVLTIGGGTEEIMKELAARQLGVV